MSGRRLEFIETGKRGAWRNRKYACRSATAVSSCLKKDSIIKPIEAFDLFAIVGPFASGNAELHSASDAGRQMA